MPKEFQAFSKLQCYNPENHTSHGYCCENLEINFLRSIKFWKHLVLFRFKKRICVKVILYFCEIL
jgi:hypothetical protein